MQTTYFVNWRIKAKNRKVYSYQKIFNIKENAYDFYDKRYLSDNCLTAKLYERVYDPGWPVYCKLLEGFYHDIKN